MLQCPLSWDRWVSLALCLAEAQGSAGVSGEEDSLLHTDLTSDLAGGLKLMIRNHEVWDFEDQREIF